MPYIDATRRKQLNEGSNAITPGELNYLITSLAVWYLRRFGTSYRTMNDILGAIEGAKQEFYRRVVAPYEDTKKSENGDVY